MKIDYQSFVKVRDDIHAALGGTPFPLEDGEEDNILDGTITFFTKIAKSCEEPVEQTLFVTLQDTHRLLERNRLPIPRSLIDIVAPGSSVAPYKWADFVAELQGYASAQPGGLAYTFSTDVSEWGSEQYWKEYADGDPVYLTQCETVVNVHRALKAAGEPIPPALERYLPTAQYTVDEREQQLQREARYEAEDRAGERAKKPNRGRGRPGQRVAREPSGYPVPPDADHTSGLIAALDSGLLRSIGPKAFLLWLYLLRPASPSERHRKVEGLVLETLGKPIGLSVQNVRTALKRLEWTGMIDIKPGRFGGDRRQGLTSVYTVHWPTTQRLDAWRNRLKEPTRWGVRYLQPAGDQC